MKLQEGSDDLNAPSDNMSTPREPAASPASALTGALPPSACPTCGAHTAVIAPAATVYVYAIGRIEPRFPRPSVEKEFAQATGRAETAGLTDHQAWHKVLSDPNNRYLVRQLCWIMTIEGLETYILTPRNAVDFDLLVDALRSTPSPVDLDIVIGVRGPIALPEMCNGLAIPIVGFDQIYWFDRDSFIKSIPRPKEMAAKEFGATVAEVLDKIMQMADNAGAMDEHRALNYLAVRYPAIYTTATESHARNYSLTRVDVTSSPLSGVRRVMDVMFSYTNRSTDVVEKYLVRVDVTEEFPFLVTKMSPSYDRQ